MSCTIFRWLHFSDLHVGHSIGKRLWPAFKHKFFDDLAAQYRNSGPWDAVLFTGDLTQMGSYSEFEQLDQMLEEIWRCFADLGSNPKLIAVPGNHDLARPDEIDSRTLALQRYWETPKLQERILNRQAEEYRNFVAGAFAEFSNWQQRQIDLGRHASPSATGLLPGDASYLINANGHQVGIVGLNSTWLQLGGGNFSGRLAVDQRQLLAITGGDPDTWCRANDANFILTHHPTDWLHKDSREAWPAEIDTNYRFDSHFFGHMHDHDQVSVSRGGGQTRHSSQASSLFGLEMFADGSQERVQGYSLNHLFRDAASMTLRVWPRTLHVQKDKDRKITADASLGLQNDQFFDVGCTWRSPKKSPETERTGTTPDADAAPSEASSKTSSHVVVTLASQPEAITAELEKIRHYVPNEPAHTNVRTLEKRKAISVLRDGRVMWSISDWGMGEDGFLGVVQHELQETGRATYSFDFGDYRNREEFLVDAQERFGVPFEVLCANIDTVGPTYVLFNDIPTDRQAAAGEIPIEVDIEEIAALLSEFAPQAKVVLRAARAPRGVTRYPIVELKALDEPDVAVYLREHPQGGNALTSPETISTLYGHTDGVPSRLDGALRKLAVSSLKTVVRSDTDRGDRTVVASFPPALVNAVLHIEQAQKAGAGSPYDLLKALACLPRGDQIEDIARLNGAKSLRSEDALMLVDRGLVDSVPFVGLDKSEDRTGSKTLMVSRPVREYVRSQLSEAQARNFDRKMIEVYFGRKWTTGKITGSRAARNAASSLCQMHVVNNSCTLIIRYVRLAVSRSDSVQIEAGIRLASAFVECLDSGSHHRAAADLCADILELIPIDGYARQRTILELERGRNLRMIRKGEEARDLLLDLDFSHLSKGQRQSAQLNLALIYKRLGESDQAAKASKDCIATDGRSDMALQAKSILIEQENDASQRQQQLETLRQQSDRKKAYVNANNIAITLATNAKAAGNLEEARRLLREVIAVARQQQDFYNGARAIADLAESLPSGIPFESTERRLLMDAYHFAHAERLSNLFDQCHRGLWKAFEAEGDIENLLRLYRSSSFIWRLHGRDSVERGYLETLRGLQNRMAGQSSDRDYFVVRVIFVLGDNPALI